MSEWILFGNCQFGEVFLNPETRELKVPMADGAYGVIQDWSFNKPTMRFVGDETPGAIVIEPRWKISEGEPIRELLDEVVWDEAQRLEEEDES